MARKDRPTNDAHGLPITYEPQVTDEKLAFLGVVGMGAVWSLLIGVSVGAMFDSSLAFLLSFLLSISFFMWLATKPPHFLGYFLLHWLIWFIYRVFEPTTLRHNTD